MSLSREDVAAEIAAIRENLDKAAGLVELGEVGGAAVWLDHVADLSTGLVERITAKAPADVLL